jgi:leader peptidase (prepilin peptidase)/N-methyltransferase
MAAVPLPLVAALFGALVGIALDRTIPRLPYTPRRRLPGRFLLLPAAAGVLLGWLGVSLVGQPHLLAILALYTTVYFAVAVIDYETHRIPNVIIFPATVAALVLSVFDPRFSWQSAFLGSLLCFALLWVAVVAAERLYGEGAFGMGDAKLGAFIGATTGASHFLLALALGIFATGLVAVLLLLSRRASRRSYIPYGPFLCLGAWIVLLWGDVILKL